MGRDGTGTSFVFLFLPREGISFGLFTVTSAGIFFIIIIIIIIIIVFAWGGEEDRDPDSAVFSSTHVVFISLGFLYFFALPSHAHINQLQSPGPILGLHSCPLQHFSPSPLPAWLNSVLQKIPTARRFSDRFTCFKGEKKNKSSLKPQPPRSHRGVQSMSRCRFPGAPDRFGSVRIEEGRSRLHCVLGLLRVLVATRFGGFILVFFWFSSYNLCCRIKSVVHRRGSQIGRAHV